MLNIKQLILKILDKLDKLSHLTQVTDCNNATDPNATYYTNGDSTNLNRPVNGWSVVKNLFLNGDPASGNDFGLCQIGMPMKSCQWKLEQLVSFFKNTLEIS